MTYKVILSHFTRDSITIFVCNRGGEALTSHICHGVLAFLMLVPLACAPEPDRRTVPSYDLFTGRLLQLSADQNGDGRIDQWTYLDGQRPLRGEADIDGDGRVDRWEYFDAQARLVSVGTSSRSDGIEDTWTQPTPTPEGETYVAHSRRRDRRLDRHEFYRGQALVRAEEDTNGDGAIDRWDRYEGTVLREVAFDTTFAGGRPDRRVLYDAQGRFSGVETDPDGDGKFVRVQGDALAPARNPGAF